MKTNNNKLTKNGSGKNLKIEVASPCEISWTIDNWKTKEKNSVADSGLGIYFLDLNTKNLPSGDKIIFTFFWTEANKWEGKDYTIEIE